MTREEFLSLTHPNLPDNICLTRGSSLYMGESIHLKSVNDNVLHIYFWEEFISAESVIVDIETKERIRCIFHGKTISDEQIKELYTKHL